MSDQNPEVFDQETHERLVVVPESQVLDQEVLAAAPEAPAEYATQESTDDKPAYLDNPYLKLGADESRPDVVNSGPQVAYVNRKFGIEGDVFTEQTAEALADHTSENGGRSSRTVGFTLYNRL